MGCGSSADVIAQGGMSHGINFKFPKRALNGKYSEGEAQLKEMMKEMTKDLKPEDKLLTEENIAQKRVEAQAMLQGMGEADKAAVEAAVKLIDTTCIDLKVKDGSTIKIYMQRPKSLTTQQAPAMVWARGGGAVMFEAEDFNEMHCPIVSNLHCVFFNVGFRNGPEVKCPTGQEDFVTAFFHIHENAAKYGLDPTKICAGGISGGGWISLGAANLMVKRGGIEKVNSLHINTGMISCETRHIPKAQWHEYEQEEADEVESCFRLHATDWEKQQNDDQLFPGNASDQIMKKYPPVVVYTAEFDYLRRDNEKFAKRLSAIGRLVDIEVMPGCTHGLMGTGADSQEAKWAFDDQRKVFDACVKR